MWEHIARFYADEDGATAIEYALIASLISVAIIGSITYFTQQMEAMFGKIGNAVDEAGSGTP